MKKRTVSILGCGWLGTSLAIRLLKEGYEVKGSTTREEKLNVFKELGIQPFMVKSEEMGIDGDLNFFNSEILVLNIPPGRHSDKIAQYIPKIKNISKVAFERGVQKLLFVSSTSVYPDLDQTFTEDTPFEPEKDSGKILLEAENILFNSALFKTTVVRLGGLYGVNRHPGRFLSGKKVEKKNAPVNMIHQVDAVNVLAEILRQNIWGEVFNACADVHPSKEEFYTIAAEKGGFEKPFFDDMDNIQGGKIISSEKMKKGLNFKFVFSNPIDGILSL